MSARDPDSGQVDERAAGLAMIGAILFFVIVGIGVGVFFEQPVVGGIGGGVIGIVVGLWLVPGLVAE